MSIKDDFGVCMAAFNYSGAIMASRTEEKDDEEYEDDCIDDDDMDGNV